MSTEFSADEVFALAQRIEQRGVQFYRAAAWLSDDPAVQKLFTALAEKEGEHEQVFTALRESVPQPPVGAPGGPQPQWKAVAGIMLSQLECDLNRRFTHKRTTREILTEAMAFEKDTVVFLVAMRDMVPAPADKARVDDLIREEMGHLVSLGSQMATGRA